MTLTQLRYLVAIADAELNITLAATRWIAPARRRTWPRWPRTR